MVSRDLFKRKVFPPRKILVVKNRAMGDSLMGLSSLSYIKTVFSNIKITYGLPSWIIPLYRQTQTPADSYLSVDLPSAGHWFRLYRRLKEEDFDLIIELHQAGRTAKFFKMFSLFSRVPYFFHNHHLKSGGLIHNQGRISPSIQRDLDACWSIFQAFYPREQLPLTPTPPHYLDFVPQMRVLAPLTPAPDKRKTILLGMVASRETKMWPVPYYKKLCQLILDLDPQYRFLIPLSSSPLDQALEKEIRTLQFPHQALILKEPLEGLPALAAGSEAYIGNDTGLKHLCVALNRPTFTFFGPEGPSEWHPYNHEAHPFYFLDPLPCRTRVSHYCGLNQCDSMICLNTFTPEQLLEKLRENIFKFKFK